MSKNIVIVYFSGYGHTRRMAESVAAGAGGTLLAVDPEGNVPDTAWDTLAAADAIIFGAPTYMGNVPWQFKKFLDASSKVWMPQGWKNKIAGGFTNSASLNGDKLSTLHYLITVAMQHGMIWVGNGMLPSNGKATDRATAVNVLGSQSGAMAQTPYDASVEEMFPGDLETARQYGARVAELTAKFNGVLNPPAL